MPQVLSSGLASVEGALSEADIAQLDDVFNFVDSDRNGVISEKEVVDLHDMLSITTTAEDVANMFRQVDLSHDGRISRTEFARMMLQPNNPPFERHSLENTFKAFKNPYDSLGRGQVRTAALRDALGVFHPDKLCGEEIDELLHQMDPEKRGVSNFQEFVHMRLNSEIHQAGSGDLVREHVQAQQTQKARTHGQQA